MSRLTAKQERFAEIVASGATLSDAYRGAYDASNMLQTTIWAEASKLMNNPKVAERIKELVDTRSNVIMAADAKRIRAHVFDRLLFESTNDKNRGGERIKALELLGKTDIVSMFKERIETETAQVDDIAGLEALLKEKLENLLGASAVDITPSQDLPHIEAKK